VVPSKTRMDGPVQPREYREDDAAAVRACVVELQEYERTIDPRLRPGSLIAAEYLTQMLDRCGAHAGQIFVVECGGVVAGFVTVLARIPFQELDDPLGEYALISDLVVLERFRRRGLGTALLNAAQQHARLQGARELRIGVLSANHAARQLYGRVGFSSHAQVLAKRFEHTDADVT
jgi:GNAT superfamily N-acetyltransferase